MDIKEKFLSMIDSDRLADNLWRLVNIPSPTGSEKKVAVSFAQMLTEAGAKVRIDNTIVNSPNIIGRLKGRKQGKTLLLAGHIDHIDVPHDKPRRDADVISGRGAADMKNGLAGILEIVKLLNDTGCNFPGEILVTVYGLHEAPTGDSKGLLNLLESNIKADAAVVFEGPDDCAAVMANGMSIWNMTVRSDQPSCHELCSKKHGDALLSVVNSVLQALLEKNHKLKLSDNPYKMLPQESIFLGQLHYGDFYNRLPSECFLQGTRRWHPDKSFEDIKIDFNDLLTDIKIPEGITIETTWQFVGDSYSMSPDEQIVHSLRNAYKSITDRELPIRGHSSVTDACRFVRNGKIPAVLYGFGTSTGHSDLEYVNIKQLVDSCKVALLTVLDYLEN